ncbi:ATP-binding protein [Tundrisphaera sp. TA3]|uniref:ATP-binding protein n=1 Tax=Tundrisphaera sp. TA3 TaxID=3435775 RepID=UPI003EBBC263
MPEQVAPMILGDGVVDLSGEVEARLAAESGGRRYRFLAKAIPQIVWTATRNGRIDSFNPRWSEYSGLSASQDDVRGWHRALHPDDVGRWREGWERARASGVVFEIDVRLRRADGTYRYHLARALPVVDRDGGIIKWLGTCTDIDDQKRAEGMLAFLAEVSSILASSLDDAATVAEVARMAVPHIADRCLIDVIQADGATRRLAVADPAEAPAWKVFRPEPPARGEAPRPTRAVRPELIDDVESHASRCECDHEHLGLLREQGPVSSAIQVPLAAHGRSLGLISLAMGESGRRYGPGDLTMVEDLARRVASAVDNARLFREARQARVEAEAANRAKDRFLAVLSHELRTPLTPILAEASAMLDDPRTPPALRPFVEMTHRNVELEARLIDDLLDLNRIGRGKLRLSRKTVDIHRAIRQALEICRPGLRAAGLTLEVELGAARYHAAVDPARFQQVIWNLLKNATKFTPEGGTVAVRTRDDGPRILIEVADTGIGIEPDALPLIFDAFEQGGAAVTRRFGGLGLGLAISRSLADAHGGSLRAASAGKGQGSTFTLGLPAVAAPAQRPEDAPPPAARPADSASLRILLVEDNADTLRVMSRLLAGRGHKVTTAADVASALRADQAGEFDLIVSDLGLPDGSGIDLMKILHARRPVPAIALSGFGMDDDLARSREAGFAAHLTKPVEFPDLEATIRRVLADRPVA